MDIDNQTVERLTEAVKTIREFCLSTLAKSSSCKDCPFYDGNFPEWEDINCMFKRLDACDWTLKTVLKGGV